MALVTHKIYTITPNPALDLSGHVDGIRPNEKNYVRKSRKDPGGNGINAARIAHRLGARVTALGFCGGAVGEEIKEFLDAEGVKHDFVAIAEEVRTNVSVTDDRTQLQTRLTFPGPRVRKSEQSQLLQQVKKLKAPALLMLGGSLPENCPEEFYGRLIRAAAGSKIDVVADLPAKFLKPILKSLPSNLILIKPNQAELEEVVGRKLSNLKSIGRAARELSALVPIVCVSLAEQGAIVAINARSWHFVAPKIHARGTVGAGDSMVGAILTRLARSRTVGSAFHRLHRQTGDELPAVLAEAFRWGLAAGAATAEVEGTAMARPQRIAALVGRIRIDLLH